jgi:hypothetical protein
MGIVTAGDLREVPYSIELSSKPGDFASWNSYRVAPRTGTHENEGVRGKT